MEDSLRIVHMGRSWTTHEIEDACPCPQEPCGLINVEKVVDECPQHALGRSKTMRQGHNADQCATIVREREGEKIARIFS